MLKSDRAYAQSLFSYEALNTDTYKGNIVVIAFSLIINVCEVFQCEPSRVFAEVARHRLPQAFFYRVGSVLFKLSAELRRHKYRLVERVHYLVQSDITKLARYPVASARTLDACDKVGLFQKRKYLFEIFRRDVIPL